MNKYFQTIIITFISLILLTRCAQYVPPSGGKRDNIPPKLLSTIPKNQSTNFNGQSVELEFDEYIMIENLNQQLLITPDVDGTYTFKQKPKGLKLIFDKPFRKDVTYTLNFRNAVKDFSERNPGKNVKLVFSTGSQIDSLSVSGKVKDLQSGKIVLDALVGLYKWADTSKVSKLKPYYFTRSDSSGNFNIENIQAGEYRIFTLIDLNNNLLFNADKEKIGFVPTLLQVNSNISGLEINMVKIENEKIKQLQTRPMAYYYNVEYSRGIKNAKVKFHTEADSMAWVVQGEKQIRFFNTLNKEDTIRVNVTVVDSLENIFNHEVKIKFRPKPKKEEGSRERFNVENSPKAGEDIDNNLKYQITFSKPVKLAHTEQIKILSDTLTEVKLEGKDFSWNNFQTELTLIKAVKAKSKIRVLVPKGTFISIENDSNQVFKNDYPLRIPENYGIIAGEVKNAKTGFIIQLIDQTSNKIVAEIQNQVKYQFNFVKAGTYLIRAIIDENKNGHWDFGDPDKFILPERIIFFPNDLKLKQNFELTGNDFDLK